MKTITSYLVILVLMGCARTENNPEFANYLGPEGSVNLILDTTRYTEDKNITSIRLVNNTDGVIYAPENLTVVRSGNILLDYDVQGMHGMRIGGRWRIKSIVEISPKQSVVYNYNTSFDKTVAAYEICVGYAERIDAFAEQKDNKIVKYTNYITVPCWPCITERRP